MFRINDPLEKQGRAYMMAAGAYLETRADYPIEIAYRRDGPTPLEVFAWFHILAPARVFRAVLSAQEAAAGIAGRDVDAMAAAKSALVGFERSLAALVALAREDNDPRIELLQSELRALVPEIERRFPEAREFERPGLDRRPATRVAARSTDSSAIRE
jgi:hypothetical protein